MRRVINWVLLVLALAALAVGALVQTGLVHLAAPPLAFGVAAAVFVALLAIRSLPLNARRPVVFLVTLALLAALTAGLAYFQFVIKPTMLKGFMAAAFAPKPTDRVGRAGDDSSNGRPNSARSARCAPIRASSSPRRSRASSRRSTSNRGRTSTRATC